MVKTRRISTLFSLLLILGLLLAACTSPEATTDNSSDATQEPAGDEPMDEAPTDEEPADDPSADSGDRKVATFIFTQEFDSLSPLYTGMWFSVITYQIWNDWAWEFDENSEPVPVMVTEIPSAENGGISEDGRVLTFNLRDDLVWSDGTPLTSEDFVFTYEMIVEPANTVQSAYPYDLISSVTAPDPQTVVVEFAEPFAPWLATLWHGILPAHVLRPVYEADGSLEQAEWNMAPTVSAGPYVFNEWESGSFASFVVNENYYGERPLIDEIFIRFVPDDASQVAALRAGDGDLGTFIAYSDVPGLEAAGVTIESVPSGYNEGWFIYMGEDGHPALQDVRVRQALAMGFDRFTLVEDLLLGLTAPAATLWDNSPYNDPAIEPYPYDPEQAAALLEEAGWVDTNGDGTRDKDGVELILVHGTTTREIRQDSQAVAQQQLAEIGVGLEIVNFDADIFFGGYSEGGPAATGELDISQWSDAAAFPDPDHSYWLCSQIPTDEEPEGSNWQRICDEELDALFAAQTAETDVEARTAMFHEITRTMFDEVYWLGLWQDPDIWALSGRLTNVRLSGATPFFNVEEWDIQE